MKGRRGWNGEPRESIVQSGGISDDMYWFVKRIKGMLYKRTNDEIR